MSATVGEVAVRSLVGEGVESSWLEGTSWQKASDASRDKGKTGITTYGSQQELGVDGSGAFAVRVAPRKAVNVE